MRRRKENNKIVEEGITLRRENIEIVVEGIKNCLLHWRSRC